MIIVTTQKQVELCDVAIFLKGVNPMLRFGSTPNVQVL